MKQELLTMLFPTIALLLIVVVVTAVVHFQVPRRYYLKWLLLPLALFGALFIPSEFNGLIGYPYPKDLPNSFKYLSYRTVIEHGKKQALEVWLIEGNKTRLYKVPYVKQLEKQLQEADEMAQKGGLPSFNRQFRGSSRSDGKNEFEIKESTPQDLLPPKDGVAPDTDRLPDIPTPDIDYRKGGKNIT